MAACATVENTTRKRKTSIVIFLDGGGAQNISKYLTTFFDKFIDKVENRNGELVEARTT